MEQDGGVGGCNDRDLFQDFLQSDASDDNAFEAALRADFWFEIKLLVCEIANVGKTRSCEAPEVGESNSRGHSLLPYRLHLYGFANS